MRLLRHLDSCIRATLNAPSAHLGIPLLCGFLLFLITFKASAFHMTIMEILGILIVLAVGLDVVLAKFGKHPKAFGYVTTPLSNPLIRFFSVLWAALVIVACLLDIIIFKPALFNPDSYFAFTPQHAYVRFFSNWCWTLVPIGLLTPWPNRVRWPVVAIAFIFPILVLDRNRWLHSCFALISMWLVFAPSYLNVRLCLKVVTAAVITFVVFGLVGNWRSGEGVSHMNLPYDQKFKDMSTVAQWTTLYGSAGLYNLSGVMEKNYRDKKKFAEELGPTSLYGRDADSKPLPLDEPLINAGSEFMPFYVTFGASGVIAAGLGMVLALRFAFYAFANAPSVFTFILVAQLLYVTVLAEFNPQFYKLSTFVVAMAALSASWLARYGNRRGWKIPGRFAALSSLPTG